MSTNSFFRRFFAHPARGYPLDARMLFIPCACCFRSAAGTYETCAHIHTRLASNDPCRVISHVATLSRRNFQRGEIWPCSATAINSDVFATGGDIDTDLSGADIRPVSRAPWSILYPPRFVVYNAPTDWEFILVLAHGIGLPTGSKRLRIAVIGRMQTSLGRLRMSLNAFSPHRGKLPFCFVFYSLGGS